jgi:hypothetical protein
LDLPALIACVSTTYGYILPAAGAPVAIETVPQGFAAQLETVRAPADAASKPVHQIVVNDQTGHVVDRVPWPAPVSTIHERDWWNVLLGSPAGHLPYHSSIERIDLEGPAQEHLPLGPAWLRAW